MVLGYLPFKLEKRVRFPLALPNNNASDCLSERQAADNRLQRGSTPRRGTKILKSFIFSLLFSSSIASASDFIPSRDTHIVPFGAIGLCEKYDWACESIKGYNTDFETLESVNSKFNRSRPITDDDQYGVSEFWSVLSSRGGDCEDYALSKKEALIELGFDSNSLFIAVVLERKNQIHAVLIWRSPIGDLVLDNLTDKIKPWKETGYHFILVQNQQDKSRWNSVTYNK